ncbi:MAG: hypothetical protein WBH28_15155 [Fuerstiella sp.]
MSKNAFHRRAQTLENEFFHRVDQELIIKLQEQHQLESDEDALAIACGIVDRKLLDELLAVDITPKTLAAFALFPAVYVAWANGYVEIAEKNAVLQAAHNLGLSEATPAYQLLECWLQRKPAKELVTAWKDLIHAARPTLSVSAFRELHEGAMKRANKIAEAAGGILGIGCVSTKEKEALAELEAVFADAAVATEPASS